MTMIFECRLRTLAGLALLWLTAACAFSQKPDATAIGQPLPAMPVSEASIGAKISLPGLARHLEQAVPTRYHDSGSDAKWAVFDPCRPFGHCEVRTKVCAWDWEAWVSRTPFVVRPVDGGLSVTSTYTLRGRVDTKSPCPHFRETTEPDGVMTLTINVRPTMDQLYAVDPHVSYDPFNWKVKPGIKLFDFIKVSFGTAAKKAIDKPLAKAVDRVNADMRRQLDFQQKAREGWAQLHEPFALDEQGTGWISVKPLSLHMTPVTSDNDFARLYATLRSRNEALFGPKPPAQDAVALPILQPGTGDGRFAMTALARLDYAALVAQARKDWLGRTIRFDQGEIKFFDFAAFQSGERLAIGTRITARSFGGFKVEGWLWIAGKPVIQDGKLALTDIDYRANTNNALVQAVGWLFRAPAKRELEKKLVFDIGDAVDEVKTKLNAMPSRPIGDYGEFRLAVDDIAVLTPVAEAKELVVPLSATGTAEAVFFPFEEAAALVDAGGAAPGTSLHRR